MTASARAGADLRLLRAAVFAVACVALSAAGHEMASGTAIPGWALLAGWVGVFAVAAPLAGRERSLPGIAALMLGGQITLHVLFSTGQWCATASGGSTGGSGSGRTAQLMALAGRLVCHGGGAMRLTPAGAERLIRQAGIDPAAVLPAAAGHAASAMHGMAGMAGMADMPGMAGTQGMPGMQGGMGYTVPMLGGHLAAALIAGLLLRRGEAALWRLVRLSAYAASWIAVRFPLAAAIAAVRALVLVATVGVRRRHPHRGRGPDEGAAGPQSATLRHSVVRRGPPRVALAA